MVVVVCLFARLAGAVCIRQCCCCSYCGCCCCCSLVFFFCCCHKVYVCYHFGLAGNQALD